MKPEHAAFLYLILFNIQEVGSTSKFAHRIPEIDELLAEGGYPGNNIAFDNSGEPLIDWNHWSHEFDYEDWLYQIDSHEEDETTLRPHIRNALDMLLQNPNIPFTELFQLID